MSSRRHRQRIWYVHLKDLADTGVRLAGHDAPVDIRPDMWHVDSRWRPVELGRGLVDFDTAMQVLSEADYQGWWAQDLDSAPHNRLESATYTNHFMRGLAVGYFRAAG